MAIELLVSRPKRQMPSPHTSGSSLRQLIPDHSRDAKCYDISPSLRYRVRRGGRRPIRGTGRMMTLSSSGLLFRSESKLLAGDSILAALDWPVKAADGAAQFLVLSGYVVQVKGL